VRPQRLFDSVDLENREVILRLVERNSKARILDCGCGTGDFTILLTQRTQSSEPYGVEFVEDVAGVAEKKGIRVHRSDLNKGLPFEDGIFDFVCANQVIEHLYETDVFVKEVHRVLKLGGYAIFSTPNLASLHNMAALLFGKQPFPAHISNEIVVGTLFKPLCSRHQEGRAHLRLFACDGMKRLLEHHGFQAEEVVGVGYYPFPVKLARWLSRIDKRHSVYLTMKMRK